MSSTAPVSLAHACGQLRPLRLAVESSEGGRIAEGELHQHHGVIGSDPECEIALSHPDVTGRVACLQVVEGQVFIIPFEGMTALKLTPATPFHVGPFSIRLFELPSDLPPQLDDPLREPATDPRFPRLRLEQIVPRTEHKSVEIDRRITFLGRVSDPQSLPLAYLVLTYDGLFVVDLLSDGKTLVNGEAVRSEWLAPGDELQVGRDNYVVKDAIKTIPTRASDEVGRISEALLGGLSLEDPAESVVPLLPSPELESGSTSARIDADLYDLLQHVNTLQSQLLDQFRRTVEAMIADFGNLKREQLVTLRDEMARMSDVTSQLNRLRNQGGVTVLPPQPVDQSAQTGVHPDPYDLGVSEKTATVHEALFERLTRIETERPGLWKRLRGLLGGNSEFRE